MTMNKTFYRNNAYHLIFETKELAKYARTAYSQFITNPVTDEQANNNVIFLQRSTKTNISFARPNEIIYALPGQDQKEKDLVMNVIIGEKIGWIVVLGWMKFVPICIEREVK